jgi:hypothetical protein
MDTSLWNMDSGFAAARRPGMTNSCDVRQVGRELSVRYAENGRLGRGSTNFPLFSRFNGRWVMLG